MPSKKEIDDAVAEITAVRRAQEEADRFRRSWRLELSYVDDDLKTHRHNVVVFSNTSENITMPLQEVLKSMVEAAYLAIITELGGR